MKKAFVLIAAVASIFAAGCKRVEKSQVSTAEMSLVSAQILEGKWNIQSLTKDGVQQQIAVSEINFEKASDEKLSVNGNSGVNSFFGEITVENGKVTVGDNMASTKMAGSPEAMEFEDDFLACLTGADSFEVSEKLLKISTSEKKLVLVFEKSE